MVGWHGNRQRKHGCRSRELAGHLIRFYPHLREASEQASERARVGEPENESVGGLWREGRRKGENRKWKPLKLWTLKAHPQRHTSFSKVLTPK